jgi:hypothetical protein
MAKPIAERTLTPEQEARLRAYAAEYGPGWKDRLISSWITGSDDQQPNGHLLRQIRNQLGPTWLKKHCKVE